MIFFLSGLSNCAAAPQVTSRRLSGKWHSASGAHINFLLFFVSVSMFFLTTSVLAQSGAETRRPALQSEYEKVAPINFDVVSIRPANTGSWFSQFTEDGYSGTGVPVSTFIRAAFDQIDAPQIIGMPGWVRTKTYTIQAKTSGSDIAVYQKLSKHERSLMLQPILIERFKLRYHHEMRSIPVYALILAKGGPFLSPSEPGPAYTDGNVGEVPRDKDGTLHVVAQPLNMTAFARKLSYLHDVGSRMVVDRTGLTGYYRFNLFWAPQRDHPNDGEPEVFGPSIYTALKEQLGLQLKLTSAMEDTLVIDHIEEPTPN